MLRFVPYRNNYLTDVEVKVSPIVVSENVTNTPAVKPNKDNLIWKDLSKGIRYQVQILSSPKSLDKKAIEFRGLERMDEYRQNGVYKYLAGCTNSYKEAKQMQEQMKELGFKDAFVIAFENRERIDLSKAISQTTE